MAENPTPGSSDILGPEPGDSDILGHETGDTDELGPETGDTDILGHETGNTDELGPETGDTDVLRLPGYLIAAGAGSAGRHEHRGSKLSGRDDRRLVVRSPLAREHLPGLLAFPEELGIGQAEPGDGPAAGTDNEQLGSPVPAGMAGAVAVPAQPYRSERFAVMADWPHATGVASISGTISALPGV